MWQLVVFNLILIIVIVGIVILLKKFVNSNKGIYITLLISSILTILCHYSSFIILLCQGTGYVNYLKSCPNLILPIYPCNTVMWLCFIYGLIKNKDSKFAHFCSDYIYYFGIIACLIGMFANVDFIKNPTLADWEITKSIVAHAFMLLNVLLIRVYGLVRVDLPRNMLNIFISIIGMLFIGLYCNLMFKVLASEEVAYNVNSMFLIHSPFDDSKILTYPLIAGVALVGYFLVFLILEFIRYPRGNRWYNRISNYFKEKKNKHIDNIGND